ncbi:MAG: TetR/AcrR family transcriptional regulator [Gammaproteobacteria bacterium]|nr:TetR/AcrR family transcriptional regulator [Gammaproteobacteria bacterium]
MKRDPTPVSTKDRILDAAEALFADAGYDGVSLRQITSAAGVELALANYHFGPKSELFVAVVRRRAEEINRERMALLAALPDPPTVEGLVAAFARPFMEKSFRGGPGWKSYARLVAQIANSQRWTEAIMRTQFDPVAEAFIKGVKKALPGANLKDLYWGFHFMLGAMTMTFAETGRIDVLSKGRCKSSALDKIYARLVPFLAAGFRRLAEG